MADGQNCVCISGYVRQNGVCELPPPNCGANEIADGQNCVCVSGYVRQNGACELPPPNCGANEIADGQNCVCISGYVQQNGAYANYRRRIAVRMKWRTGKTAFAFQVMFVKIIFANRNRRH